MLDELKKDSRIDLGDQLNIDLGATTLENSKTQVF